MFCANSHKTGTAPSVGLTLTLCVKMDIAVHRVLISVALMVAMKSPLAEEMGGIVCLGNNLAKVADEHSRRLHLQIDDSSNIYFKKPYNGPELVVKDLSINNNHTIKVYFDGNVVQSWKLNFAQLNTKSVVVWRSAGSWRMDTIEASSCK